MPPGVGGRIQSVRTGRAVASVVVLLVVSAAPAGASQGGAGGAAARTGLTLPTAAGLAVVTLLGGWLLGRRRNERSAAEASAATADLLEAARRLTRIDDIAAVGRLVVEEAARLTGARGVALVRVDAARVALTTQTEPPWFDPERIGEGTVADVVTRGRTLSTVSWSEPAVERRPAGIAGAPLVVDGEVRAVLVMVRGGARSFDARAVHALTRFAPIAAGALASAERFRSEREQASLDALTGLPNRRSFDRALALAVGEASGTGGCVSALMVDLDDFKQVNDTYGHVVGDEVLRAVAGAISEAVRDTDLPFRFGGEEFSIVLPGTDEVEATRVAERVRSAVEALTVAWSDRAPEAGFTVSVGVAGGCGADAASVLIRADAALYEAKAGGRNRVAVRTLPA